jgi:hypothetical protein
MSDASNLGTGSIANRQTEVRLEGKARRVFTPAGWNKVLREAGIYAGNWWIGKYGVLRFDRGYARQVLGYKPGERKLIRMFRYGEAPFYSSGDFMAGFNSRARTVATAKKGHASFWVVIPAGRLNFHPEHAKAFRRVPARESAAVAREFRRAVIQGVMQGRAAHAARAKSKAAAREARRAENAKYRAAIRANRAVGKANARAQLRADRASVRAAARQLRRQRTRRASVRLSR